MSSNTNFTKIQKRLEQEDNWVRTDPKRDKNNFKEQRRQSKKNKDKSKWDDEN